MNAPTSEFPKFHDGDVTIVISSSKIYQLHSHTLRRLSPFFAAQLDRYPGAKLSAAARREGIAAYRFEINTIQPEMYGPLARIKVSDNGAIIRDQFQFPTISSRLGHDDEEERLWDWLFGSFYNIAPKFEDDNLTTVLQSCMGLIDTAESIGSVEHVREVVDLALLRQSQKLWQAIATNPTAWSELGLRVQSATIFREAIIHLVGRWQEMTDDDKAELAESVYTVCQRKHAEIEMAKRAVDLRILGHYPAHLSRSHVDKPHRTSYSADIYMWMAISFFRHYYAQTYIDGHARNAKDGGYQFYTNIAAGGNTYLHHEDFKAFHQYFPMSSKACNVLEANMNVLKEDVKPFVEDLVRVRVHVHPDEFTVKWLTCAVVEKEDLPWEQRLGQGGRGGGDDDVGLGIEELIAAGCGGGGDGDEQTLVASRGGLAANQYV